MRGSIAKMQTMKLRAAAPQSIVFGQFIVFGPEIGHPLGLGHELMVKGTVQRRSKRHSGKFHQGSPRARGGSLGGGKSRRTQTTGSSRAAKLWDCPDVYSGVCLCAHFAAAVVL